MKGSLFHLFISQTPWQGSSSAADKRSVRPSLGNECEGPSIAVATDLLRIIRGGGKDLSDEVIAENDETVKSNEYLDDLVNRLVEGLDVSKDDATDHNLVEKIDSSIIQHTAIPSKLPDDAKIIDPGIQASSKEVFVGADSSSSQGHVAVVHLGEPKQNSWFPATKDDINLQKREKSEKKKRLDPISNHGSSMSVMSPLHQKSNITSVHQQEYDKIKLQPSDRSLSENFVRTNIQLAPIRPPNAIYRFFLPRGTIARLIVMISLVVAEFLHSFCPELYNILKWLFTKIGVYDPSAKPRQNYMGLKTKKSSAGTRFGKAEVDAQYSAFVSADGTSTAGGKKATRDQQKVVDAIALRKLQDIGPTHEAKYRHLSLSFMKRFNLGPYADEVKVYESMIAPTIREEMGSSEISSDRVHVVNGDDESDEEDWVVKALSSNDPSRVQSPEEPFPPAIGVVTSDKSKPERKKRKRKKSPSLTHVSRFEPIISVGSSGTTVGLSFTLGSSGKTTQSKMLEAAAASRTYQGTRKKVNLRKADRDGGVLGRLRAVGASSIMSSRILGAYPGDAPPPEEAGNARGVIALATRYGYGDWSDSETEDTVDRGLHFKTGTIKRKSTIKVRTTPRSRPTLHTDTLSKPDRSWGRTKQPSDFLQNTMEAKRLRNLGSEGEISLSRVSRSDELTSSYVNRNLTEAKTSTRVYAPMKRTENISRKHSKRTADINED